MKKRKLLKGGIVFGCFALLTLSTAIGISHHDSNIEVNADSASLSTLYLKPNSNWQLANARFAAYFFQDNNNTWVNMNKVDRSDMVVYSVAIPTDKTYGNVIFCRMDPNKTENNWTSGDSNGPFWNQTNNLTIDANEGDCYTIADDAWSKGDGSWSNYSDTYSYSINGGTTMDMIANSENTNEYMSSQAVSLNKDDKITFSKNGEVISVNPNDDNQLTKVYKENDNDNYLVVAEDFTETLYFNYTTNKVWAGQFTPGYYVVGSFNSWNKKTGSKASLNGTETGVYVVKNLELVADATLKFIQTPTDGNTVTYYSATSGKIYTNSEVETSVDNDGNLVVTNAGTYNVYYDTINECYSIEDVNWTNPYKVKIDGKTYELTANEGNEYKLENLTLTAGTTISVVKNDTDVSDSFTAKTIYNNNLSDDKAILANTTDATLYVDISAKTLFIDIGVSFGYHMLKNGELVTLTKNVDNTNQWYTANISFKHGDEVRFIDIKSEGETKPIVFDAKNIDEYSDDTNAFKYIEGTGMVAQKDCEVSIYLTLNSDGNTIYINSNMAKASKFASEFLTSIRNVCKQDGSTDVNELKTAWQAQITKYNKLSDEVKAILKAANESHQNENIKEFVELYVLVLSRYGTTDQLGDNYNFLEKNVSLVRYVPNNSIIGTAVLPISLIVGVSIIALTSIGSVLYLKKRKHI